MLLGTGTYPECAESSPNHHIWIMSDPFMYHFFICAFVSELWFQVFDQNYMCVSHLPMLFTCPAHLILLDLVSTSICNFLHPPVICKPSDPNILLSTLFSNILSVYFFCRVKDSIFQAM
jgi:hypothetical protein